MEQQRFAIQGSEAQHTDGGNWLPANPNQLLSPTIIIRRPPSAGDVSQKLLSGALTSMTRDEAENLLRVDPTDLSTVLSFAHDYGLKVVAENANARTVQVEGSLAQINQAFGTQIQSRTDPEGRQYLTYRGSLTLPLPLKGIVEAVLGLDQRPVARHQ